VYAQNPYSGAYGIPQALPGAKMATAGPDWRTSARTQIRWGLRYIRGTYGSPLRAWDHEVAYGWY
jgi:resuscitation-promoting factor RpfB